ncbi:hypothetical protein GCM10029978_008880 [Actinoallomurus acanthiterrae]
MLRLLVRRARAQWPLLAALLTVVMVGSTLLGTYALLVTRTADRALEVAASRVAPDDVDVTAYTVTVRGADARSVADDTRRVLASALAPFAATTAARASSVMRSLPRPRAGRGGVPAQAYLSGMEDPAAHAQLTAGRWPRAAADAAHPSAPLEAVVLEPTARLLGLTLGSRVHLGAQLAGRPRHRRAGVAGPGRRPRSGGRRDRRRLRTPAARHRLGP